MTAPHRCKRFIRNCKYCTTGVYKRPARRRARHEVKLLQRSRGIGEDT